MNEADKVVIMSKKTDLSLLDYSEAENGKEFDYPESAGAVPIFKGSFLTWGKPDEVIYDKKIASRKKISLIVRLRCCLHQG